MSPFEDRLTPTEECPHKMGMAKHILRTSDYIKFMVIGMCPCSYQEIQLKTAPSPHSQIGAEVATVFT